MGLPTPIGALAAILAISSMLPWEHALFRVLIAKLLLKVALKIKVLKEPLMLLKDQPKPLLKDLLIVVLKEILTVMEMVSIPIHLPATSRA